MPQGFIQIPLGLERNDLEIYISMYKSRLFEEASGVFYRLQSSIYLSLFADAVHTNLHKAVNIGLRSRGCTDWQKNLTLFI